MFRDFAILLENIFKILFKKKNGQIIYLIRIFLQHSSLY